MIIKTFDIATMMIEGYTDGSDNRYARLKELCDVVDDAIFESNASAVDVEIDDDDRSITISIYLKLIDNSVYHCALYDVFQMSDSFRISAAPGDDYSVLASFMFKDVIVSI